MEIQSQNTIFLSGQRPQICCVGGGKGGTGKSILALNLAGSLAAGDLKVVLADMDLGGANLHTLSGLRHCPSSIRDFFGGKAASLGELLVPIDRLGISLLPGGDEAAGVVQPGFQRKQKLIRHLHRLDADVVVCDLGGNLGLDTLDLFNAADCGLVVVTPEPTAIQNAYGFVKAALLRKVRRMCPPRSSSRRMLDRLWDPSEDTAALTVGEFIQQARSEDPDAAELIEDVVRSSRLSLVVNQAGPEEGDRVFRTLAGVARRFLDLEISSLGHVAPSSEIREAVARGRTPLFGKSLFAAKILEQLRIRLETQMAVGINEEIRLNGEVLHVQTEDLGPGAAVYHTLVYSGGEILLSKRVPHDSSFLSRAMSELKQDRVRFLHRTVVQAILSGKIKLSLPGSRNNPELKRKVKTEVESSHASG